MSCFKISAKKKKESTAVICDIVLKHSQRLMWVTKQAMDEVSYCGAEGLTSEFHLVVLVGV